MGNRSNPRARMVLPVKITGKTATGEELNVIGYTIDVSASGARLAGVKQPVAKGSRVTVQYKQQRAEFEVVWAGAKGTPMAEQIGVRAADAEKFQWPEVPDERKYVDSFQAELGSGKKGPPPVVTPAGAGPADASPPTAAESAFATVMPPAPPSERLALLAQKLREALHADGVSIALPNDHELVVVAAAGTGRPLGSAVDTKHSFVAEAFRSNSLVYAADTKSDKHFRNGAPAGALAIMLISAQGAGTFGLGLIEVIAARTNAFSSEQQAALRIMAELLPVFA